VIDIFEKFRELKLACLYCVRLFTRTDMVKRSKV